MRFKIITVSYYKRYLHILNFTTHSFTFSFVSLKTKEQNCNFFQLGKTKYHKSHHFDISNEVSMLVGEAKPGIGGERLPFQKRPPPNSYIPRGQGTDLPSWVAFDKQVRLCQKYVSHFTKNCFLHFLAFSVRFWASTRSTRNQFTRSGRSSTEFTTARSTSTLKTIQSKWSSLEQRMPAFHKVNSWRHNYIQIFCGGSISTLVFVIV